MQGILIKPTAAFRNILCSLILFCALASCQAFASDVATLYKTCQQCHSDADQAAVTPTGPVIAGQYSWYLTKQLRDFQAGIRGAHAEDILGQQMAAMSGVVPAEIIEQLADYIALQPSPPVVTLTNGDLNNGYRYYQGKCGACHGSEGQGNTAYSAPNLRLLSSEYILRQMQHFKQGVRGSGATDRLGKQMRMMAGTVSAAELNDIVFYLGQ